MTRVSYIIQIFYNILQLIYIYNVLIPYVQYKRQELLAFLEHPVLRFVLCCSSFKSLTNCVLSCYVSQRSDFRVVMSFTISHKHDFLFVFTSSCLLVDSSLNYGMCASQHIVVSSTSFGLVVHSGVQHIFCFVCLRLVHLMLPIFWIVHFLLSIYYLTFIYARE